MSRCPNFSLVTAALTKSWKKMIQNLWRCQTAAWIMIFIKVKATWDETKGWGALTLNIGSQEKVQLTVKSRYLSSNANTHTRTHMHTHFDVKLTLLLHMYVWVNEPNIKESVSGIANCSVGSFTFSESLEHLRN